MTNSDQMQELYARFEEAGISREYIRDFVLPDWWDDEIADNPGGYLEGLTFIAKHLGIDLETLRNTGSSLSARTAAEARFKLRADIDSNDVNWAQSVSVRAAEMAAHATTVPLRLTSDLDAASVRQHILEQDTKWVDLDSLLKYCWKAGVPVLHLPEVPGQKMDGMAVKAGDRPVIVVSMNHKHEAWLLFILAHEMGHVLAGHLDSEEAVVDTEYDPEPADEREIEANRIAVELITGDPDFEANLERYVKAPDLAEKVKNFGKSENVSPGAVILNVAYYDSGDPWGLANATLNELHPDPDAPEIIRARIRKHLDWNNLPDESAAFLARVTGVDSISEPAAAVG